jgi:hypothetical protein
MDTSLFLTGIIMLIIVSSTTTSLSNRIAYAHTFSQNENALFITMVQQIEAQVQLAQNNLAQQHINLAISLLNQNDPIVNDTTWVKEIAERNPRVAAELTSALNSLKSSTTQLKPASTTTVTTSNTANDVSAKVSRINGLLDEAVSSRINREVLKNATTQALVLARLGNLIYFIYGRALGESPSMMSSMAGMAMPGKGASSSMNMNNTKNMKSTANSGMSSNMAASMTNSNAVKNLTNYQTAQSLAAKAQELFNKSLKPIATSPKIANANVQIERDLSQLKTAIDNKAPFMDIMNLVHVQLHPTLITAYNLKLKSF